jgi:hypothetical protein
MSHMGQIQTNAPQQRTLSCPFPCILGRDRLPLKRLEA